MSKPHIVFGVKPHYFGEDIIGGDPYPCDCDDITERMYGCPHSRPIQEWFARQEAAWQATEPYGKRRNPTSSSKSGGSGGEAR